MSVLPTTTIPGLDVIVLAAGPTTDTGVPLAAAIVDGQSLINHTLQEIAMTRGLQQVVVVSDRSIDVLPGVKLAVEPTAGADLLAAIATGVRNLWHEAAEETAIMAAWTPELAALLPDLWEAIGDGDDVARAINSDDSLGLWGSVWRTTSLWKFFEFYSSTKAADPTILFEGRQVVKVDADGYDTLYDSVDALQALGEVQF